MENLGNDFQSALPAGIGAGDLVLNVVSAVGSPASDFRIRVDDELMLVTNKGAGTNWTVTRGVEGTVAAAHLAGATVTHVITAGGLASWLAGQIATVGALLATNNLSDVANQATARTNLGLGS